MLTPMLPGAADSAAGLQVRHAGRQGSAAGLGAAGPSLPPPLLVLTLLHFSVVLFSR